MSPLLRYVLCVLLEQTALNLYLNFYSWYLLTCVTCVVLQIWNVLIAVTVHCFGLVYCFPL